MFSDYDLDITYHEGKANIVADMLSRKLSHSLELMIFYEDLSKHFERFNLQIIQEGELEAKLSTFSIQTTRFKRNPKETN